MQEEPGMLQGTPVYRCAIPLSEPRQRPKESPADVPQWRYIVEFVTGSYRGAGTPNMATMQLFGTNGQSSVFRIGDDNDNDNGPGFARDSVKHYAISSSSLGAIRRIHLKKDLQKSSELGSGWFLERVVVTGPDGNATTFPCHQWIGEPDDGSGARALFQPIESAT
jgi:PLAT/LH2 domain